MVQERQRQLNEMPFLLPINLKRLDTLGRDAANTRAFKVVEAQRRRDVIKSGWAKSIDEGRFPKSTYEYGLQLDELVEQKHPGTVRLRWDLEDSLDHGVVQFLSIRGLSNLQRDLAIVQRLGNKVTRGIRGQVLEMLSH